MVWEITELLNVTRIGRNTYKNKTNLYILITLIKI